MSKSVPLTLKRKPLPVDPAQAFVEAGEEVRASDIRQAPAIAAPKEKMVRITLDVGESVHRDLKIKVATRGCTLQDYLRGLIERDSGNQ